jgi:hypothetical protein
MARNRDSAKSAGRRTERLVADFLAQRLDDDRIDRAVKRGVHDVGDIGNVRTLAGHRIAIEVKDTSRTDLAGWAAEAEAERINLGALAGVTVFKRHGVGAPEKQWVVMTLEDFAALITEQRTQESDGPV